MVVSEDRAAGLHTQRHISHIREGRGALSASSVAVYNLRWREYE